MSLDTPWEIESHFNGIRKLKKIYYIRIGTRESMRVTEKESKILRDLGRAIEEMRKSRLLGGAFNRYLFWGKEA